MQQYPPTPLTIYQRTTAGQQEVVTPRRDLQPDAIRLLLLINGYTPLGVLQSMMNGFDNAEAVIHELEQAGLIKRV